MTTTSATRASGVSVAEKCVISALDFFQDPFKERAIENVYKATYSPIAAICPTTSNIEFHVPPSSDFISPRHTMIETSFRILNLDDTPLTPDTETERNLITCIQSPGIIPVIRTSCH